MRTIDSLLREVPAFKGMAAEHLEVIARCGMNRVFSDGEYLTREGQHATTFYVVREGNVAVEIYAPQRGALVIETLHEDALVGWSWLVPPYRAQFDVRVRGTAHTVAFDGCACAASAIRIPRAATTFCSGSQRCWWSASRPPGCDSSMSMGLSPATESAVGGGPMTPVPYRLERKRRETADTWTLVLDPAGEQRLGPFAPGQFAMLYAFGAGEVPISVSRLPDERGRLTHTVATWARSPRASAAPVAERPLGCAAPSAAYGRYPRRRAPTSSW